MCGGFTEMHTMRASRLHQDMKQNMPHAAPAGLAIVAALEAELVQSGGATFNQLVQSGDAMSRTKPAESAPFYTTSSLPIPISSSSSACDQMNNNNRKDNFPAYCSDYIAVDHTVKRNHITRGAQQSIFSTSLSPPCDTYNYIVSCNLFRELYDDFLAACFSCKRPLAPGKDIYMYRGDRAFCSTECRYKHIVADESLPSCTIPTNQQCVQASSPSKKPKFAPPVAIAILV